MGYVQPLPRNVLKTYLPASNFQLAASEMVAKLMAQKLHRRERMSHRDDTRMLVVEMRGASGEMYLHSHSYLPSLIFQPWY